MILSDCHMHTIFSTDGISCMEDMINSAADKGLKHICFTEHNDHGAVFAEGAGAFVVDTDRYYEKYLELREKYKDRIEILFGIEAGLQPSETDYFNKYTLDYPFDFVIGSSHFADGIDPSLPAYYQKYSDTFTAYHAYFEAELKCARIYSCYDSYGHLDYALRYGPGKNSGFTYEKYADVLDELLSTIISGGKLIEVNSAGLRKGMGGPNPAISILRRYYELGGRSVTIGSDAHRVEDVAYEFNLINDILMQIGFSSYSIFRERQEVRLPLQ